MGKDEELMDTILHIKKNVCVDGFGFLPPLRFNFLPLLRKFSKHRNCKAVNGYSLDVSTFIHFTNILRTSHLNGSVSAL